MKKLIYLLFAISLFQHFAFGQWEIQPSAVSTSLLDVEFINRNTGWACGDGGVIVKTTNGGINWVQQFTGVSNKRLEGIHPVDSNIVYCVGWFQTILKTTNGGINWLIIRNGEFGTTPSLFEVYFINQNTGWLLRNNYILRTNDGCQSFDSTFVVFSYLRDIYFKDNLNGVLCGDGALIMRSTDGGVNWFQVNIPVAFELPDFGKESFIGDTGWVVGSGTNDPNFGPLVWRTTNFGTTWDTIARVSYPYTHLNYCVFFSSVNTGWCGGEFGHIFKTTNGGFNWIEQQVPSVNFRRSMWFYNDSIGWAVGGAGQIVHTTTSGSFLGIQQTGIEIPSAFKLYQNYPNPFNPETNIDFDLTKSGNYKMEIYDILGRKIETVFDGYKTPGKYRVSYNASMLASGIYFYVLSSAELYEVRKFTLIK